jgi:hypothetical protein
VSIDALTNKPDVGYDVKACARNDTACAAPLGSGKTGDNGSVTFTLPTGASGFDGFFAVTGPSDVTDLSFVATPLRVDTTGYRRIYWGASAIKTVLATTTTGVTLDPMRGVVAYEVHDCAKRTAAGMTVTLAEADDKTVSGTVDIAKTAFIVGSTVTDYSGQGGFANVRPGPVTLTVRRADTGDVVAIQEGSFGTGQYAMFAPSPQR